MAQSVHVLRAACDSLMHGPMVLTFGGNTRIAEYSVCGPEAPVARWASCRYSKIIIYGPYHDSKCNGCKQLCERFEVDGSERQRVAGVVNNTDHGGVMDACDWPLMQQSQMATCILVIPSAVSSPQIALQLRATTVRLWAISSKDLLKLCRYKCTGLHWRK